MGEGEASGLLGVGVEGGGFGGQLADALDQRGRFHDAAAWAHGEDPPDDLVKPGDGEAEDDGAVWVVLHDLRGVPECVGDGLADGRIEAEDDLVLFGALDEPPRVAEVGLHGEVRGNGVAMLGGRDLDES